MIRQLTIVRKFRNAVNLVKAKNPAKKGKMGVCVGAQKKILINLQMKIQGGLGALRESEESTAEDVDILTKEMKEKSETQTQFRENDVEVEYGNNLIIPPFVSPRKNRQKSQNIENNECTVGIGLKKYTSEKGESKGDSAIFVDFFWG